jgi:pyruvate dehydrogenase E1 component
MQVSDETMAKNIASIHFEDADPAETKEWLESLEDLYQRCGPERVQHLLTLLEEAAYRRGVKLPFSANTPYINTIPVEKERRYPGNREIERRIKSIVRWNAMAMVVRANRESAGIGGHISTYASCATLLEVGFNHFFKGKTEGSAGDQVYLQGHASPGIYARAFLEGRLQREHLENFRRELRPEGGLSSYPHPWLMPSFWQFPTVSMGLGPICAIYQARFNRYLENRGLKDTANSKVWCFIGDGESDEPESLGAITLAAREKLDNLIFVINCNLQRLDGPVRGNGKIIQELEAAFRGAGWNVIKVIWGGDWDPLMAKDRDGELVRRMGEVVDGQYQKYTVESGAYTREHFFGKSPELLQLAEHLTDGEVQRLRRGGHDPEKVYNAYHSAVQPNGSPTVILAKTVKGYGLGEAGEGRNITHQQKKLNEDELREFRARFGIPISDEDIADAPFYVPPDDSIEMQYLRERRRVLGGFVPERKNLAPPLKAPPEKEFTEFHASSGDREVSTTMAFVRMFGKLLKNKEIGKLLVPIIPDESRTFGMEALFRSFGIYSHYGQVYEPVDRETLLYYREAKDGQILEEGITEAGSMASFIAAGTAYATHGVNTIPFFIYYSMFGFQRVGDLIWDAADSRARGFLCGGTAGRTTLNGEGLQHQDGHSHLLAATVPNIVAYDPAYGYETAVIVEDGIRRMYQEQEPILYYITLYNENYLMPSMPKGVKDGILRGMYRFKSVTPKTRSKKENGMRPQLFGSGPILREVLRAQDILADKYGVGTDVWSVTSYKELRREALAIDRLNRLHPAAPQGTSYVAEQLAGLDGPFVAATDYMRLVAEQIAPWVPGRFVTLGTDGFGRSDTREVLRRHFEVDAECIVLATLDDLARRGEMKKERVQKAIVELGIDPEKIDPVIA